MPTRTRQAIDRFVASNQPISSDEFKQLMDQARRSPAALRYRQVLVFHFCNDVYLITTTNILKIEVTFPSYKNNYETETQAYIYVPTLCNDEGYCSYSMLDPEKCFKDLSLNESENIDFPVLYSILLFHEVLRAPIQDKNGAFFMLVILIYLIVQVITWPNYVHVRVDSSNCLVKLIFFVVQKNG